MSPSSGIVFSVLGLIVIIGIIFFFFYFSSGQKNKKIANNSNNQFNIPSSENNKGGFTNPTNNSSSSNNNNSSSSNNNNSSSSNNNSSSSNSNNNNNNDTVNRCRLVYVDGGNMKNPNHPSAQFNPSHCIRNSSSTYIDPSGRTFRYDGSKYIEISSSTSNDNAAIDQKCPPIVSLKNNVNPNVDDTLTADVNTLCQKNSSTLLRSIDGNILWKWNGKSYDKVNKSQDNCSTSIVDIQSSDPTDSFANMFPRCPKNDKFTIYRTNDGRCFTYSTAKNTYTQIKGKECEGISSHPLFPFDPQKNAIVDCSIVSFPDKNPNNLVSPSSSFANPICEKNKWSTYKASDGSFWIWNGFKYVPLADGTAPPSTDPSSPVKPGGGGGGGGAFSVKSCGPKADTPKSQFDNYYETDFRIARGNGCWYSRSQPNPENKEWQHFLKTNPIPSLTEEPLQLYADQSCLNDSNVLKHFYSRYKCFENQKTKTDLDAEKWWSSSSLSANSPPQSLLMTKTVAPPWQNDRITVRIVGGDVVAKSNVGGYVVAIKKDGKRHCTGVIISPTLVLTAAHCIYNSLKKIKNDGTFILSDVQRIGFTVEAGGKSWSRLQQVRRIKRCIWHPLYSDKTLIQDICLIETDQPFVFNSQVYPVKLPSSNHNVENKPTISAGYGIAEQRKIESGRVVSTFVDDLLSIRGTVQYFKPGGLNHCEKMFLTQVVPKVTELPAVLCFRPDTNASTCQGDSGGGFIQQDDKGHDVVIGLTSYGLPLCTRNNGTVITNVIVHLGWLKHTINRIENNYI